MYTLNKKKKAVTRARANQVNLILNDPFTMYCSIKKQKTDKI